MWYAAQLPGFAGGPSGLRSRPILWSATFCGRNSLPETALTGALGENHVAAGPVKIPQKGVQRCNRPTGLCRIGVLPHAIVHIQADRSIHRQQMRRLPDLLTGHPSNSLGARSIMSRCKNCKRGEHWLAENFLAAFRFVTALTHQCRPDRDFSEPGVCIIHNRSTGAFVPYNKSLR